MPDFFYTEIELQSYLAKYGITAPHDIRACTEAALFSPLKRFLFQKETYLLTDEAGQFRLPSIKQALFWLHIERKFKQLLPYTNEQSELIQQKQDKLWKFYDDLKNYRSKPLLEQKSKLREQFYDLCAPVENETALNEILNRIKRWEEKLLLVLDYPLLPLHNSTSEGDIREIVRRRKVSGGTRHDLGRECRDTFASLKKTCQKFGVTFWDYLIDRTFQHHKIPPLGQYVQQKSLKN